MQYVIIMVNGDRSEEMIKIKMKVMKQCRTPQIYNYLFV